MAQPNMGKRKLYMTRFPMDIAERLDAEADKQGIAFSQLIADIVAGHYGLEPPSQRFMTKSQREAKGQEALPIAG